MAHAYLSFIAWFSDFSAKLSPKCLKEDEEKKLTQPTNKQLVEYYEDKKQKVKRNILV